MSTLPLIPQAFDSNQITQLPAFDMLAYAKGLLPQVYQNAPNFMAVVQSIAAQKQYLYDVMRSLINVMNLNSVAGGERATPVGVYLQMLASIFNAPYTAGAADYVIFSSIQNAILFVNSRGLTSDFYNYFAANGLAGQFTNNNVEEDGNATLLFNVPVADTPSSPPNPFDIFTTAVFKLKAAGIETIIVPGNIPYFQYGSLPTDTPPNQVAPGNAGFGVLTPDGVVVGGGFYTATIP